VSAAKKQSDSLAVRLLRWLARGICARPRWFVYPQIFIFVFGVIFTVKKLQFDTSRNDLVGSDKKYHQNFLRFKKEFPTQDDLVVVVESESMEKNRQFVERLGVRLEAETNLFTDVFYKGDLKMLGPKALLFVPVEQLQELKQTLRDFRPFIEQFTKATNLTSLFALVNRQFRTAKQEQSAENESLVKALPALERIIVQATQALKRPGTAPSPGLNALFGAGDEAEREIYITYSEGRMYLVTARALTEELNGKAVERLRDLVQETRFEVSGVNVGITGEPVLEYDEMAQSQKDSALASIVSLIVCALIFIYGYNETGRPLKATLCLIVGLGYTMFFTTLAVGHLNILTITFVPILIGLAIDFGVHLITRFEEELRNGRNREQAIEKAIVNTGLGIFTGAFTTAGAFFAMALTNFKGIQEMGIICGGGMLLCLVPMMTLLPVLLLRGKQNVIDSENVAKVDRRAKIENFWLRRPVTVIIAVGVLCGLAVLQTRRVHFDYNLLHMQSKGLPAVVFEHKLIASAGKSVLFGAIVATNLQELAELKEKVKKLPSVAEVDPISEFLTEDQTKKLELVREIKKDVSSIHFANSKDEKIDIPELSRTLWALQGYLGLAVDMTEKDEPQLSKELIDLRSAIMAFRKEMLNGDPKTEEQLLKFQNALFSDIRDTFHALQTQDASGPMRAEDLPLALRNRFIGVTGKYLLQVYPKADVWQRNYQEEFVKELRTVDPNVTGTPVQLYEYTTLLKDSYQQAAWYALGAIAILVFIHFHSLVAVILALLPVGIGALWMTGLMGEFGILFNPANIMTLPLVIGIGVTNGIHILNRFAEERTPAILAKSTGKAVLVSGLTTIAGFGSLILAKHQGIASLGFVMAVGVTTCMFAALTFLPALLNFLIRAGWKIKEPSDDNAQSPLGSEEPR
jgi:hopanoid biosynthesis associated RND transporter like protein HpnN